VNFGILPLTFEHGSDYKGMEQGDVLRFRNLRQQVRAGHMIEAENVTQKQNFKTRHSLSERQVEILLSGGLINRVKRGLKR
jgi:aconitate hydratase